MNHCSTNPLYTVITKLCDSCEILYRKSVWSLMIGLVSFFWKNCHVNATEENGATSRMCVRKLSGSSPLLLIQLRRRSFQDVAEDEINCL